MDIVVWLRTLGLGKYEAIFRENDIDETVLPSLTHENLKELGVTSLGHRVKLLDAIAALRGETSAAGSPSAPTTTPSGPSAPPEDRAERRQVTVMFSDLVGSTALSARMDPEDLREVIAAYHKCAAEIVRRFGGFVSQYLGDGVLAYFGYPQAHEDDAERAVRASLELIAAVAALKTRAPLQTRVGIATGLVVVGDVIDAGGSQERGIIGETPNLAARLQGLADPNTVVIGDGTRKLLGNLFVLEDLGVKDLKGIARPVRAWLALRPASADSRFEALHASGVTELVGREEELDLLLRRWLRAKSGDGQVVLLSGEPGIGKSRLTAALLERLTTEPHTRLRYFCSPQHTDSALYPIISQLERAAGFAYDDSVQAKLDKLDTLLMLSFTPTRDAALIAEILSLSNDGRYPNLELTPQQRREKTLESLTAQLEALSRSKPVLMIFEDVHWADPTSQEVLSRTLDRIKTLGVLLIITYRPEFQAPWIGRPYVTALTLNRLGQRETDVMIDRVTGKRLLPDSVRHDIIERSDGIPLFVEEMTKAVLEAGGEGAGETSLAPMQSPSFAVPASLHASLMARLDRLGFAKEIAQIGAAIGREFSYALLGALSGKAETELQAALDRTTAAGLLFRQGVPPHATYLFKHALVQDAAYSTLLRGPRRALHARIAETLESRFLEIAENLPELVARHCTEAGLIEKAISWWGKAGQRSLERSALVEAVEQFTRALGQIATLPMTPAGRREQIALQVGLITPLMHVKGYGAPETRAAVERATLLIEQAEARGEPLEDSLLLFSVLHGGWQAHFVAFNGEAVCELAAQFLALAQKHGATLPLILAYRHMGTSLLFSGQIAQGRAHYDQAIALYNPVEHRRFAAQFGQDSQVANLSHRSLALWLLGYPDAAIGDARQAVNYAREIGHAASLLFALFITSAIHIFCTNYNVAISQLDEVAGLAGEKRALFWKSAEMVFRGHVFVLTGKAADAVQMMVTSGIAAFRSTGSTLLTPWSLSNLSRAYAEIGKFNDAQRCISEAMTAMQTSKETWFEPEVHRTAGEIALMSPQHDTAKAQEHYDRALNVARQQQAKSWELRAAMSLARLWRDQDKKVEARELLAPVYGWFTEGFDTRDLKEAKALLEELAS
jgi:class 3 adenylate cyclase/predicted ATPase